MRFRISVTGCALLLLLAGCESTADAPLTVQETSPQISGSAPTPATGTSPTNDAETSPTAPPHEPPSPDTTTVMRLQLAEDRRAPVAEDLERLVKAWVRYAMGGAETFPHRESVSLAVGGETAVTVSDVDASLSDRDLWKQCPPGRDSYGASSCPVDLLGPVRSSVVNNTVLVYSSTFDDVTCAPARTNPLPPGRVVVMRPVRRWRTCATDFAITLVADRQGRLHHADITLSDP